MVSDNCGCERCNEVEAEMVDGKMWTLAFYDVACGDLLGFWSPDDHFGLDELDSKRLELQAEMQPEIYVFLLDVVTPPAVVTEAWVAEKRWRNRIARECLEAYKANRIN